jgi:GT2 family glycosyltransferase
MLRKGRLYTMNPDDAPDVPDLASGAADRAEKKGLAAIPAGLRYSIDELVIAGSGDILVTGWIADSANTLAAVEIDGPQDECAFAGEELRRRLRRDVAGALGEDPGYCFGFWAYRSRSQPLAAQGEEVRVVLRLEDGSAVSNVVPVRTADALQLRRQGLVFAAIGTEHEDAFRAMRPAEWMHWLNSGPEIARFVAECGEGLGRAISAISMRNAIEPDRRVALAEPGERHIAWSVDTVVMSEDGALFVVGWLDDEEDPAAAMRVSGPGWHATIEGKALARVRREDVEGVLQKGGRACFGFWTFLFSGQRLPGHGGCRVELLTRAGHSRTLDVATVNCLSSAELRNVVLTYLANSRHFGTPVVAKMGQLSNVLGEQIVAFNRAVSRAMVRAPYVERFVTPGRRPKASIVVCLYGKPEYLFLQAALFSGRPGMEDYEFIYVSNSPELAETLVNEARNARLAYGQELTLVLLPGNAGFGAANNLAIQHARSDRVLIVNPDVFPKDADWAARHTALVEAGGPGTRLFGVPLYYDDGSLMHGGMFFELDTGLSAGPEGLQARRIARVEHYGKGAPPVTRQFLAERPVPAVTGAFISCERAWFDRLGGFTEDYVFGHYEDADLCLKSLGQGEAPWLHDLRLWHLEGKGSVRVNAHEGGSLVNRWLFSERWSDVIADGLRGPAPTHPALHPRAAETVEPKIVPMSAPAPEMTGATAAPRVVRRTMRSRG